MAFCANVHGLIPVEDLDLGKDETPEGCFKIGQVLKPWVKWKDPEKQLMKLTLKKSMDQKAIGDSNTSLSMRGIELKQCKGGNLWPGDKVEGKVKKVRMTFFVSGCSNTGNSIPRPTILLNSTSSF